MMEYGVGSATFRLPSTGWLHSPAGPIPGGVSAFASDGALATAIATVLRPRRLPTTSDLTLNFIRPPAGDAEAIIVHGQLVHEGASQALAQATVEDSSGHLLARASTRCVMLDIPGPLPEPPEEPVPAPGYDGPHPFKRPAEGEVLAQETWDTVPGIDMLRGWAAGSVPRSPLSNLMGAQVEEVEAGTLVCSMPASAWYCGMGGTLYGGALTMLADYAVLGAVQSLQPPGTTWATLDLNVRFLRPLRPGGGRLRARATVIHLGRRLAIAHVEIADAENRPAALADASVILLPGLRWADLARLTDEPHELLRDDSADLPGTQ
jgi:uncharacterized protein (TIGR00369 family)